jgi:hypothetical protein
MPSLIRLGNSWLVNRGINIDWVNAKSITALWDTDGTTSAKPDIIGPNVMVAGHNAVPGYGTQRLTGTMSGGVATITHALYAAPTFLIATGNAAGVTGALRATANASTITVTSSNGSDAGAVSVLAQVLLS